jgi:hypothetical protein
MIQNPEIRICRSGSFGGELRGLPPGFEGERGIPMFPVKDTLRQTYKKHQTTMEKTTMLNG